MRKLFLMNSDFEVCSFRDLPCSLRSKKTNEYQFYSQEIPKILFQCNGKTDVDIAALSDAQKEFLTKGKESGMLTESEQPDPMEDAIPVRFYANKYR